MNKYESEVESIRNNLINAPDLPTQVRLKKELREAVKLLIISDHKRRQQLGWSIADTIGHFEPKSDLQGMIVLDNWCIEYAV